MKNKIYVAPLTETIELCAIAELMMGFSVVTQENEPVDHGGGGNEPQKNGGFIDMDAKGGFIWDDEDY